MNKNSQEKSDRAWHLIDAKGKVLGRLATEAATLLRGKQKTSFVPYLDGGDHVVIINAKDMVLTGNKVMTKEYHRHSWFPGGLKTEYAKDLIQSNPEKMVVSAIKGMLPKNKLQEVWLKRLHVYAGTDHPHKANVGA